MGPGFIFLVYSFACKLFYANENDEHYTLNTG